MNKVLIIGAGSAIAEACARIWAERGASLFLVARNPEQLADIAADLRVRGAQAVETAVLDVNDTAAHAAMLDACGGMLGRIDVALIAHGTLPDQTACEQRPEQMLRELSTNGTSVMALLMALAHRMAPQRDGVLAVITSVAGDRGRPSNYVYGAAKGAVSIFCEGLRARLFKAGVAVVEIRPGFVNTPMTQGLPLPQALVSEPGRIAQRIVRAIDQRRDIVYAPAYWALIMWVIRSIPRAVFKRLAL